MVNLAVRGLIILVAAFNVLIGALFAIRPVDIAEKFALAPSGPLGVATLRADFTAFFVVGGAFAAIGAIRGEAAWLRTPLALLAVAVIMRGVDVALHGATREAVMPMAIEALMISILGLGNRVLARRG